MYQVLIGQPVGRGNEGAQWCTLPGVAKRNRQPDGDDWRGDFTVANEYIAGRIGRMLGLPIPPGVIAVDEHGTQWYTCLRVGPDGYDFPPCDPSEFVADHPELAGQLLLFDMWFNNERHEDNLLYTPSLGLGPFVIDQGHALWRGWARDSPELARERSRWKFEHHLVFHELTKECTALRHAMGNFLDRVVACPVELLQLPFVEALQAGVLKDDEADEGIQWLVDRREQLPEAMSPVAKRLGAVTL